MRSVSDFVGKTSNLNEIKNGQFVFTAVYTEDNVESGILAVHEQQVVRSVLCHTPNLTVGYLESTPNIN